MVMLISLGAKTEKTEQPSKPLNVSVRGGMKEQNSRRKQQGCQN